jgi:hypothetical protein
MTDDRKGTGQDKAPALAGLAAYGDEHVVAMLATDARPGPAMMILINA